MWKAKAYKVELGSIEDAIKGRQKEAKKLAQEILSHSANARDVLYDLKEAEKAYNNAKSAFKEFQKLEEEYGKFLDRADDSYRLLDANTAFGKLNRLDDINEDLRRYNAQTEQPPKARIKEMRDAVDAWKAQNFPKIK